MIVMGRCITELTFLDHYTRDADGDHGHQPQSSRPEMENVTLINIRRNGLLGVCADLAWRVNLWS